MDVMDQVDVMDCMDERQAVHYLETTTILKGRRPKMLPTSSIRTLAGPALGRASGTKPSHISRYLSRRLPSGAENWQFPTAIVNRQLLNISSALVVGGTAAM